MLDLKALESRTFRSIQEDGLFELFYGIMLLAGVVRDLVPYWGGSEALGRGTSLGIIFAGILFLSLGRKYLTGPRLGSVRFSARRQKRILALCLILLPLAAVSLVSVTALLFGQAGPASPKHGGFLMSAVITLIILGSVSLVAYFLSYPRLYVVAVLMAATEPGHVYVRHFTDLRPEGLYVNAVPAMVLLVWGAVLLYRFLKRYPVVEEALP